MSAIYLCEKAHPLYQTIWLYQTCLFSHVMCHIDLGFSQCGGFKVIALTGRLPSKRQDLKGYTENWHSIIAILLIRAVPGLTYIQGRGQKWLSLSRGVSCKVTFRTLLGLESSLQPSLENTVCHSQFIRMRVVSTEELRQQAGKWVQCPSPLPWGGLLPNLHSSSDQAD